MRNAAYSTANIVTTIPYNAQVEVSHGATWSYVRYNGMFGYVMTAYLAFSYTPVPTATPAPTAPPVCVLGYAYVSTRSGGLNMREYASTAARVMMVIPRYARVELLTQGSTWCYVRYMGVYGYVMTRYLSTGYSPLPTAAPTSSTGAWAIVATQSSGLNIREASYVGARILIVAPKGSTVTVVEHGTTSNITYNGVTGYAMTGFLNFGGGSSSVVSTRATRLQQQRLEDVREHFHRRERYLHHPVHDGSDRRLPRLPLDARDVELLHGLRAHELPDLYAQLKDTGGQASSSQPFYRRALRPARNHPRRSVFVIPPSFSAKEDRHDIPEHDCGGDAGGGGFHAAGERAENAAALHRAQRRPAPACSRTPAGEPSRPRRPSRPAAARRLLRRGSRPQSHILRGCARSSAAF